ncbi:MAG: prepilin-type N-terminal cleavage/methylation domain-containing protein [Opitutaceae bacterium]|jgi:prepilin-type N-terminal cleavage/methylation domain-containing protein
MNARNSTLSHVRSSDAFTLIELLTVIAIIGILAAIIIPTVGAVKVSANKAKSKVQFSQWAAAITTFKQEYGYYPVLTGTTAPQADQGYTLTDSTVRQRFVEILSGRKVDGTALTDNTTMAPLYQNKRRVGFYSFSDSELTVSGTTVSSINDAFTNTEIRVVIDYGNDGLITSSSLTTTVKGYDSTTGYAPASTTVPTGGVRAGVVFYSAGKGNSSTDVVTSW